MTCAGRFGKDAVDYAKGLAKGHSSCEQQALKEMLDLLCRCSVMTLARSSLRNKPWSSLHPCLIYILLLSLVYKALCRQPACMLNLNVALLPRKYSQD